LNDQGQDKGFVLIFGQNFADFLEGFSGQNSDLVLLIGRSVFQDGDK
jgi:hypothetical protein